MCDVRTKFFQIRGEFITKIRKSLALLYTGLSRQFNIEFPCGACNVIQIGLCSFCFILGVEEGGKIFEAFLSDGIRNRVKASGSNAKPTFCNTRAAFRGDMVTTSLVFPAFLVGAAEPPSAAELPFLRERFALFGMVADLDMMM